jgi:Ran GTPase-activating protein (RanGAP) involved in mRNA processing and transport
MCPPLLLTPAAPATDTAKEPPQTSTLEATQEFMFRELGCHIFAYTSLETLGLLLQVNTQLSHAARYHLSQLLPRLKPLMVAPFHFMATEVIRSQTLHFNDGITDDDVRAFAEACERGALAKLEWLGFGANHLGDVGMSAFARACARGALPQLEGLSLCHNRIGNKGLSAFSQGLGSEALPRLKQLYLYNNQIGDAGLASFAEACACGALPQLRELSLYGNEIGSVGMSAFAGACSSGDALPLLEEIDVSYNQIGDVGLAALSSALTDGALASLDTLYVYLDDDPLGEEHAPALSAACELRGVLLR